MLRRNSSTTTDKKKDKTATPTWNGGCPEGCKFNSYLVSTYLNVNCAVCGNRLTSGTKMASCSACDIDICHPCKKKVKQQKKSSKSRRSKTKTDNDSSNVSSSHKYSAPPSRPKPSSSSNQERRHSSSNNNGTLQMCVVSCVLGGGGLRNKKRNSGGGKVEMMIDSGASNSAISYGLAKRLGLDRMMSPLNGRAFGVGSAQIVGHIANVPCVLKNMEFLIDFLVLDGPYNHLDDLLLLGLDQMRKHGCMIDLQNEIIYFGGLGAGGVQVPMANAGGGSDDVSVFTRDIRSLADNDDVSVIAAAAAAGDDMSVFAATGDDMSVFTRGDQSIGA